jgi:hypothetical protein
LFSFSLINFCLLIIKRPLQQELKGQYLDFSDIGGSLEPLISQGEVVDLKPTNKAIVPQVH